MCGRYTLAVPQDGLVEVFDVPPLGFGYVPRYNIAPGQDAPVVAEDRRGRRMGRMRWGLVPAWAEEARRPFINARGETASATPSFRDAFAGRRCLVPADGFYEWKREEGAKVPYWFHPSAGGLVAMAGIWERWTGPDREARFGFAVLTVAANEDVSEVHDRMPVLLDPTSWDTWLRGDSPVDRVRALVGPAPAGTLLRRAVSTRVNSTANDDPGLLEA